MEEARLITAAKNQDVEAFNQLVLIYQDMAFSIAWHIMRDDAAAADATQNAMISAFRKLHQFRGDNFKAWLMRIVKNACYDELRRQKRRSGVSLDELEDESDGLDFEDAAPLTAPPENPEKAVQRSDLRNAIAECIHQLSEVHQSVVIFTDIEGYSYEETAEVLDISTGTVKSRLSRARSRLRECLQNKGELLPDQYRL